MTAAETRVALARRRLGSRTGARGLDRTAWLAAGVLIGVVAVAVALRFADLAANPGGLYTDEGAEGYAAVRLLHWSGIPPVWFPDDGGREALFAYLVAGVFALFGPSALALRETAAGIGVGGVVAIWLLARRFGRGPSLVAAAWAAGSLWLVAVSRDGMRNVLVVPLGAIALLGLLDWQARPGRRRALLAGALTALAAFYTYQPLKLLPVVVALWLLWLRRVDRPAYARLRPSLVPFAIAFAAVAAPMAAVALTDPASYFGRAAAVSPLNPGVDADASLPVHVLRTLAIFTITGDPNARHDVAATPLLGPPLVAWPLFLVGLAGVARLWRRRREAGHALVLVALAVFLVPPLVAVEGGSPHFLRALGLAPPLGVTIGLGSLELRDRLRDRWGTAAHGGRAAALGGLTGAIAGCLALAAALSASLYLGRPAAERYWPYRYDVSAMAAAARPGDAVVAGADDASTVRFLDAAAPPAILTPGERVASRAAYARVLALGRDELAAVVGPTAAARATVVARDPGGAPAVWTVAP